MGNCNIRFQSGDDDDSIEEHPVNFAGGKVHLVTTKADWDRQLADANKEGKTVLVNFSVSWCKPCRNIAPHFCELSVKYPSLVFLTVDVDELPEFSSSLEIKATPTFFFFKDGEQLDKLVGANRSDLGKKITEILNQLSKN